MKKILFLITFINLGICVNAQYLQRTMYNDGKILAYIQEKQDYFQWGSKNARYVKSDDLIIENISGQEISFNYCFKSIKYDVNDNYVDYKITYRTNVTLSVKSKKRENGSEAKYLSNNGYYYVDSFAIMNVSTNSDSTTKSSTETQKVVTVPAWAQGTWGRNGGGIKITSTQFLAPELDLALLCTRVLGDSIHFEGIKELQNSQLSMYVVVYKSDSPNKLKCEVYANGSTIPSISEYIERWRGY